MSSITSMLSQLLRFRISEKLSWRTPCTPSRERRLCQLYTRSRSVESLEDRIFLSAVQIVHDQAFFAASPSKDSQFGELFDANDNYVAVGAWKKDVLGVPKAGQVTVMNAATGAVAYELNEPVATLNGNFGISVSVDGDVLAVGAASPGNAGAVYLYELSTGTLLRTILSPDGGADMFGYAVDMSGGRLLAGAWANPSGGSAWVFDIETGDVLSTLNNPTPNVDDFFASQVALDGTTAIIAAIYDDTAGLDAGAVYTYDVSTTGPLDPIFSIQNPDPSNTPFGDRFGVSVSVSGDNLVIGDWMDDTNGIDSGAAYVYSVSGGELKKTLADPMIKAGNNFGARVGIRGNTVVVGVRGADRQFEDSGAGAVFDVTTGELISIVDNPTPGVKQYFSTTAIQILEDAILIGAPQYGSLATSDLGVVDRFSVREITTAATTAIHHEQTLAAALADSDSAFGAFFDTNTSFTAVGAWKATVNGLSKAGSVSVFDAETGRLAYELTESSPRTDGNFGVHVAVDGDLLAVGAASPSSSGKVYLYKLSTGKLLKTLSSPDGGNDLFGYGLDLSAGRLLVGARENNSGGRAWIFDASSGEILATLNNPSGKAGDYFGAIVALDGNKAVVAAIYDDSAGLDAGAVYIFNAAATGNLVPQQSIRNPRPSKIATGDRFGVSIAISGAHLVIGDWMDGFNGIESGAAYLYDANTGALVRSFDDPVTTKPGNNFGAQVAVLGDRVAVGIRGANGSSGAVAVYEATNGKLISFINNPTPGSNQYFSSTSIQLLSDRIFIGSPQHRSMIPQALGAVDIFEISTATEVIGTDERDVFSVSFPATEPGMVNLQLSTNGTAFTDLGAFPIDQRLKFTGRGGYDVVKLNGTSAADRFLVAGGSLRINGLAVSLESIEAQTLIGGAGNDKYSFDADTLIGTVAYDESGGGIDTIDFSGTTTRGIELDLSLSTQSVVPSNLRLTRIGSGTIEDIYGSTVADRLTGNSFANRIFGLNGSDRISGAGADDTLVGGPGHDTYVFSTAVGIESDVVTEVVNGGSDTLDFGAITRTLTVDLAKSNQELIEAGRRLTLTNAQVENVRGGQGSDKIRGNQLANTISGNQGNDILDGFDGNDVLNGGVGSDTLNGGNGDDRYVFSNPMGTENDTVSEVNTTGVDTIDFSGTTLALTLDLSTNGPRIVQTGRTLNVPSGTILEHASGGSGNDKLTGNSAPYNVLSGGAGNDTLNGGPGGGDDTLMGDDGDDLYLFGNPVGTEIDTAWENHTNGVDTIDFRGSTLPVILDLASDAPTLVQPGRTLTLLGGLAIFEHAYGGSGNDTLTGNSASYNVLSGGAGNDTLNGGPGGGDDNLIGGNGNDLYLFGNPVGTEFDSVNEFNTTGVDTIDFSRSTLSVTLDISSDGPRIVQTGRTLSINGGPLNGGPAFIEHAYGGSGNDALIGNNLPYNVLSGGDGNDTLKGGGGAEDNLIGGNGNDLYLFSNPVGTEFNSVNEVNTNGVDTIDFRGSTLPVTLDISTDGPRLVQPRRTLSLNGGVAIIEHAYGGSGNDTLVGNNLGNRLFGGAGNDTVRGGSGNDELFGGDNDDHLNGQAGVDILWGDGGNDVLIAIDGLYSDTVSGGTGFDSLWIDRNGKSADELAGSTNSDVIQDVTEFRNGADRTLNGDNIRDPNGATKSKDNDGNEIRIGQFSENFSQFPLYAAAGPRITDIRQQSLGDCYFLAGLGAIVQDNAMRIKQYVVDFNDGTYGVRLKDHFYRVDADLPVRNSPLSIVGQNQSPIYAALGHENSLWVAIVEKAFACHRRNTAPIYNAVASTYESIISGFADEANQAFSTPQTSRMAFLNYGSAATLANDVYSRWRNGESVCIGFGGDETKKQAANGIPVIFSHAYTVTKVLRNAAGTVTSIELRNPWGQDGDSAHPIVDDDDAPNDPNDGLVRLTPDELWILRFKGYVTWGKV